ncbi:formyl transferase-like protein [Amycolatopsis mediterranei S699]|uniref:Formyl transferase-like protein n=2 Tax=Amycolatopsis mediterranei TaxID=33910 RepID=A0A0H3D4X1_AMYMU|nr:formyl transferase-like protein [Amycolatopsis mediterranei U32]AEK42497.1 formyl transferase-like protein [Amycolatopsis mediterranei S699]AFO77427.1 formyl transferase-like protein [Amycolatopsis mediterranei S699]AGT84555.1 formyl transferase-like protein [Amycolatopsis mediterranei RB]
MLLCSAFNGLSQRAWLALRSRGHRVTIRVVHDPQEIAAAAAATDPELIICPFLRRRVPDLVWRRYRTIIIHPGPEGDRGPSALDWAIMDAEPTWGVTALQATGDLDGGPIWGTRVFRMPSDPPRKSTLYNTEVSDAAMSLIGEVVTKAEDPGFTPRRQDRRVHVVVRPLVRQADRSFSWGDPTGHVLRRIRAADGRPGVHTELAGVPIAVFDAHPGDAAPGEPGTIAGRRQGAVLVRTGDGALWIGHARRLALEAPGTTVKLPAVLALGDGAGEVPRIAGPPHLREIGYRRVGRVGWVDFAFHNGAMSTSQCRRLAAAVRYAAAQDTAVLVLAGGEVFSNGLHLGVIDAHPDPAAEAWRNITAIDDLCRQIIACTGQLVVSALVGDAGAGGVMLALGADKVIARDGVLLNPHYRKMGLYGSEYWTYVLPRRAGEAEADRLTTDCGPITAAEAAEIGLVDRLAAPDRTAFPAAVLDYATELAADGRADALLRRKRETREADEHRRPLETYRIRELAEMSHDIFDDRHGFARTRRAFLTGRPLGPATPETLRLPDPRLPELTPVN